MMNKVAEPKDPDIIGSLAALERAANRALQEGLETGTPVWVIKDGRVVDLTKEKRRSARAGRRDARKPRG